jgi:hypothetical protein
MKGQQSVQEHARGGCSDAEVVSRSQDGLRAMGGQQTVQKLDARSFSGDSRAAP